MTRFIWSIIEEDVGKCPLMSHTDSGRGYHAGTVGMVVKACGGLKMMIVMKAFGGSKMMIVGDDKLIFVVIWYHSVEGVVRSTSFVMPV